MDNSTKSAEQAAADEFAEDTDLDIPITDQQKEAVRWLLAQAFMMGHGWQKKQQDADTGTIMKSIKDSAGYWLDNH